VHLLSLRLLLLLLLLLQLLLLLHWHEHSCCLYRLLLLLLFCWLGFLLLGHEGHPSACRLRHECVRLVVVALGSRQRQWHALHVGATRNVRLADTLFDVDV